MNTITRLGAYGAGLVLAFAAATALGAAAGPFDGNSQEGHVTEHGADRPATSEIATKELGEAAPSEVSGLSLSQDGYRLDLLTPIRPAGSATPVRLQVLSPDDAPVREYEVSHEERMHLIAIRRDSTGFQHVHPVMARDGIWSVDLDLTPGQWRLFTDFTLPGRPGLTLGADLAVPGDYDPVALPQPSRVATLPGGYTVELEGDLEPGKESRLELHVSRDGQLVSDLQPYLGAYGHLVALRVGDLAYLHVHPDGEPGDGTTTPGPQVAFYATAPTPGRYRLFLDFKHEGEVRTAEFTLDATDTTSPEPSQRTGAPSTPEQQRTDVTDDGHPADQHP